MQLKRSTARDDDDNEYTGGQKLQQRKYSDSSIENSLNEIA